MAKQKNIPKRSEVEKQYTWALEDIFATDELWEKALDECRTFPEKIEAFRARGAEIEDGAFGENIIVQGIDFATLPVGTKFACNDVVLELTQIGKECHSGCAIFKKMGECIMPKQGVFTKVLHGGIIRPGDELTILE